MKFKTPRQEEEFKAIKPKLRDIIYSAASYMLDKYKYEITITECLRTQAEQDDIYKNDPKYKVTPWRSVHQDGRGIDLRTNDMSKEMIADLTNFLNKIPYDPKRPEKKTCLVHDVGKGLHFHTQVV
jgi:hypothetical protein